MERSHAALLVVTSLVLAALSRADSPKGSPPTPKKPVTDTYHGVRVTDDYRWLEKTDDPAVLQWVKAQNRYARAFLDRIPARKPLREKLHDILTRPEPHYSALQYAGGVLF